MTADKIGSCGVAWASRSLSWASSKGHRSPEATLSSAGRFDKPFDKLRTGSTNGGFAWL